MSKITPVIAIKKYFTQKDAISPDGGKNVELAEIKELRGSCSPQEWVAFAQECVDALDIGDGERPELDVSKVKGL